MAASGGPNGTYWRRQVCGISVSSRLLSDLLQPDVAAQEREEEPPPVVAAAAFLNIINCRRLVGRRLEKDLVRQIPVMFLSLHCVIE